MFDTFEQLVASRREWIERVLRAWCRTARLNELRKAELEWFDIAGRADTKATLWTWAWERFPDIVHSDLPGVHESFEVIVTLNDGKRIAGFPDGRQSQGGKLVMLAMGESGNLITHGPISIDDVASVQLKSAE